MAANLFHYTTIDGIIGIISSNSLFATHFRYLNDLSECQIVNELIKPIFQKELEELTPELVKRGILKSGYYEEYGRQIHGDEAGRMSGAILRVTDKVVPFFVTSFCKHDVGSLEYESGLLSQWRGYGGVAGFAIEFEEAKIDALVKDETPRHAYSGIITNDVLYENYEKLFKTNDFEGIAKEMMRRLFEGHADISDLTGRLRNLDEMYIPFVSTAPFLKNRNFQEEKEFRIVASCFRENTTNKYEKRPIKKLEFRNKNNLVTPFIRLFGDSKEKLPIKSVLIGPHPFQSEQKYAIEALAESHGMKFDVRVSKIPFRH